MSQAAPIETDILIIGAGIVGLSAAVALSQAARVNHINLKITLIDRQTQLASIDRPLVLNHHAQQKLTQWGITQDLLQQFLPIHTVVFNYKNNNKKDINNINLNFRSQDFNIDNLGAVISHKILQDYLYKQLNTLNSIEFLLNTELIDLDFSNRQAVLKNNNNKNINYNYKLLIAADGVNSYLKNKLNPDLTIKNNYHTLFVKLTTDRNKQQREQAWQCFDVNLNCSIALLPYNQQYDSLMVTSQDCSFLNDFAEKLKNNNIFINHKKLKILELIDDYKIINIAEFFCAHNHAENCLLLGSAAYSFLPLTAQGFNLTIQDIDYLAKNIINCFSYFSDREPELIKIVNLTLDRYQQERGAVQLKHLKLVNYIKYLFFENNINFNLNVLKFGLKFLQRKLGWFFINSE